MLSASGARSTQNVEPVGSAERSSEFVLRETSSASNLAANSVVNAASAKIKTLSRLRPTLALVLGSGFNHVLRELEMDAQIPYAKLPGFPNPSVAGHDGKLFIGKLGGTPVLVLSGRAHFYEGHPMGRVTFATRVLAEEGIRDFLLANRAGG